MVRNSIFHAFSALTLLSAGFVAGCGQQTNQTALPASPQIATLKNADTNSTAQLGDAAMNLRSCPGIKCVSVGVIPKFAQVQLTGEKQDLTEATGNVTPWVKVSYKGQYCTLAQFDKDSGECRQWNETPVALTGWLNANKLQGGQNPSL